MKINKNKIKNILIVRNDRFGEFLLNIPAINAVKKAYPEAKITLAIDPSVKEIAEDLTAVDEIIIDNFSKNIGLFGILRLAAQLRREKVSIAIMLNPSKTFNLISFLAMIPFRVGYSRKNAFLLNKTLPDLKHEAKKHEVEYNLDLVKLIQAETDNLEISLPVSKEVSHQVEEKLGGRVKPEDKMIAIHLWTSNIKKQWPLKCFVQLINRLNDTQENLKIIIIGGKENKNSVSQENFLKAEKVINLTGELSLRESAALLSKCRCLVSNDSGPVHLAAAVNTRTIALFRKSPPAISAKRWGPWGKGHIVIENQHLDGITVDEVYNRTLELLE